MANEGAGRSWKLKILHVTDRWITGGGQEHIYRVCRALDHHEFIVMAARDGPARKRFAAVANVKARIGSPTPRLMKDLQPDLLHFHHMRPLLRWFCRFPAPPDLPIVVTVHGLHVRRYDFLSPFGARTSARLRQAVEKKMLVRARRVVAVSLEDHRFLRERYRLQNVVTIYNGIAGIESGPIAAEAVIPGIARPLNGLVALVPARFEFQKGHDVLIRALSLSLMQPYLDRIVFMLAGDGPRRQAMQQMARDHGVDANLRFLKDCLHDTVMALMKTCDLVVLPSRWEGLPIALLEAGMNGCAVLASDACGNREILEGKRGLLFRNASPDSLAEELVKIIENPSVLDHLGPALREHVMREYSLEKMLQQLDQLYTQCQEEHKVKSEK